MSSTRCQVCAQAATHKCTDCGEVFCDLHVRLAGGEGSSIGYFCDECWEKRQVRRGRSGWVVLSVILLLLLANVVGVTLFQSSTWSEQGTLPTTSVVVGIMIVLTLVGLAVRNRARKR